VAPDLLQLCWGDIGTIVGGDSSPELLTTGLVDGTQAVSVNDLGLMGDLSVDAKRVERLRGLPRSKRPRLREEDLVLVATGRGGH
jgi:hypothetical protein